MKRQRSTSLQIRLASITILGLLIALAAVAYYSGRKVETDSDLIAQDAVPGTIHAHYMRMAMSRSIGWALAAASAQSAQSRDASLKIVQEADAAFADELKRYEATIRMNPANDQKLLERLKKTEAELYKKRKDYEALIVAGDRDAAAAFLEREVLPAFLPAIQSAEDLIKYNHANSISFSDAIRRSVNQLFWVVAIVVVLALACAMVLVFNLTIRRRELAELEENEEKFSKAFRSNPIGIAIHDIKTGRYIEVNDSFCRIMGYEPQEVIGYTTHDKSIWNSEEERSRIIQPLLSGGTLHTQEILARTRHGVRKNVSLNAELIELSGRRCMVTLIDDITERKQAMEQNEMLKVSIDKHFDAAYWMDTSNQIVYVNDAACKSVGYSREELLGQQVTLIAPNADSQRMQEVWRQLRESGFFTSEGTHRRKDGSEFPVEIVASYVRFEGREFNCGFARDITVRKQMERKQVELAAIVESSDDAIIGKTLDGVITSWNRGAEKIFGYTAAEAVGKPLLMLFPPELEHEEEEILVRIARGETVQHFETVRVCKDGRKIFISATISPLKDVDGKVTGASKITRDITAQKQAAEALRESEERIRILGDNLPSGMMYQLDMGADGRERRFTYVSAGVEKLHELTAEGVLQDAMGIYGQIVEADRPLVASLEAEALASMKPFIAEVRMQLPSGAHRWSLFTSAPRRAANGHVLWDGIELDITAQKQADEALRDKQAQLLLAMDIAKLAHWEFDVVKNIVTADEHIFQLLGTTSEQEGAVSMSPEEYIRRFVHPEDAGIVAHEVALGIAADDPNFGRQFEHRITRRDGTERVMLVRSQIIMDAGGRTGKILGTNQDITEQKQAEQRIRQLNRIYAVLSAINQTIVHEKETQGMLTKACQIAVEKGGFRMAWVGMHDAAANKLQPVASAGVVEGYLELLNIDLSDKVRSSGPSGRCFTSAEHITCNDMEQDPMLVPWREEALKRGYRSSACFPLKVGGKIVGVFMLYSDKTGFFNEEETLLLDELAMDIGFALEVGEGEAKRRQAEQELRWRTAFFEAQVHSAIDGILVVNNEGRKLLQNKRMNEMWKIPPHIVEDPDDSRQIQFVLSRICEPQVFAEKLAYLNAHPEESSTDVVELLDGTTMERHYAPVRGSDGTYYGRVWTFHDITERKKLEQQFLRAQRMESIGTLASGVAHDLNNILTPIMMSVAVLRLGMPPEKRDALCDTIEASAARGAQIVKQVLTFGRGLEGEKHPLQMDMLVDEMEQMIRSTFPKDISLECVKEPHLWPVLGDATQLHQVLLNFCVNARDAMPQGGRLRLSIANLDIDASYASMLPEVTPGPHVVLEVRDTGTGISPEVLERIFDPFFTTKEIGKGSGLGLSTVHGIVKSHGGSLKVKSTPGQGTTFQVYLPAALDQAAVADAAASAPPPTGHGELVLVVDDEPAITQAARTVLEASGYRVLIAGDATEALLLFTKSPQEIAVVLTDIMMPVMSGVLFLRTLRRIKPTVSVIASTGMCDQTQLDAMLALGVEAILHKPYNSGMLLRTINGVLHPKSSAEHSLSAGHS